jgi:hypothetical protein
MPAPQNNQGFVAPRSGGSGNWIGKLFGGIGDNYRARSMAQLQLELHGERAKIDTEHIKERATHKAVTDAAAKDYLADSGLISVRRVVLASIRRKALIFQTLHSIFFNRAIAFHAKTGLRDRAAGTQTGAATPTGENQQSHEAHLKLVVLQELLLLLKHP